MTWLASNLLTLNIDKTNFMTFSLQKSTQPPKNFEVKAHSCMDSPHNCSCQNLTRVITTKYLGVIIDDCLNWRAHIASLTARVRKLIYIFKNLRQAADKDTLRMTYFALCQSLLSYCVTAWGGGAKTFLLEVERAQRAVLKVILKKPFRYPTTKLYADADVLTVRQLYIAQSTLRRHALTPYTDTGKRRCDLVCKVERHRTKLAGRHFYILSKVTYNRINKEITIFNLNNFNCKIALHKWLKTLNYNETEDLIQKR